MSSDGQPTWKGQPVPPVLAKWFDDLMAPDTLNLLQLVSGSRYIDVILTVTPGGGHAKPPQVIVK